MKRLFEASEARLADAARRVADIGKEVVPVRPEVKSVLTHSADPTVDRLVSHGDVSRLNGGDIVGTARDEAER